MANRGIVKNWRFTCLEIRRIVSGFELSPVNMTRLFSFFFLLLPLLVRADYLPDAASHLGTLFINGDAQFTTNPLITLSIHAVSTGSGIAQMQFSTDDRNWSAAEAYATSKLWQLSVNDTDYPPQMNTVLKTVYVRVMYGNGTWSKAFSDGIVFARSAEDVPQIADVWVMQKRPSNYNAKQPLGSQLNPYIIPSGSNEVAFDTLMKSLAANYSSYRSTPWPWQTNVIPAMSGVSVLYLHLGAGTFETHGDGGGLGAVLSWSPAEGERIQGAGKDLTILKLVGGNSNPIAHVLGNAGGTGLGVYDNTEFSDLTVDANMHEGGDTTSLWCRSGVTLAGNNLQLRRLRVKGFGSRIPGSEPGGMNGFNAGSGNLYNFHIEDCEVVAPQSINKYLPLMIGYEGGGTDAQTNPLYMLNVVIRNNYVNGLMYNQNIALNPYTNSFYERASHGICLGGTKNSIIEDNFVVHTMSGYYNDVFDLNDVIVRNNHFRDVIAGLNFGTGAREKLTFEGNLVELDPHYYATPVAGTTNPSDYGWRTAIILNEQLRVPIKQAVIRSNICQFTDKALPTPPLSCLFAIAGLSGAADFEYNTAYGFNYPFIRWYQAQGWSFGYLDQQADILDATKPAPITTINNRRADGTIIEVYPYLLDKSLPRPVVVPNQQIVFPAPLINGALPGLVTGLPLTNVIDQNGNFNWTPTTNDIGRYVASFYDSVNRTNDPRRTLIIVTSGLAGNDPLFSLAGLKGYWKLGDSAANILLDSSGNGNSITIPASVQSYITQGAPGHRAGQNALHFQNTNPSKTFSLAIPNNNAQLIDGFPLAYQPYLQTNTVLSKPFTVSYWFKPDHQPAHLEVIFNFGSLVLSGVCPGPSTNSGLAGIFCYHPYSPDLTFYQALHPANINVSIGQWHHQVFVYDGVSTRLYIDGRDVYQVPCGQLEAFDRSGISLGGGWGGDNYLGSLSDLAIWNRPLSDDEVAQLYSNQSSAPQSLTSPANLRVTH